MGVCEIMAGTLKTFVLQAGKHIGPDGRVYKKGERIASDEDLAELFGPERFVEVGAATLPAAVGPTLIDLTAHYQGAAEAGWRIEAMSNNVGTLTVLDAATGDVIIDGRTPEQVRKRLAAVE